MFKKQKLSVAIAVAGSSLLLSNTAIAEENEEAVVDEEIVAVGTQIKGANIEGTLPVTVLSAEQLDSSGIATGEELLRSIPQIGSIGFGNSRAGSVGVNTARGDVSSFNLRSIGEGNTLVLINGRRMVLHPISQTSRFDSGIPIVSSNANTLPVAALERVEVLRDGAGALYGADAVAGVINYQVKDDYEGSEVTIRYGAEDGTGRQDITLSGAAGFSFNDGRTNLVLSGSYADRTGVNSGEYDFTRDQDLRSRAPEGFATTAFDNRTGSEAHANVVFGGGVGRFHLRPTNLIGDDGVSIVEDSSECGGRGLAPGSTIFTGPGSQSLCLDGGGQNRALRTNRNENRTLVPDVKRFNVFAKLTHELESGAELYGEFSYYDSEARREREQGGPLSTGEVFVSADYFFNPFGPTTLADGSVNPNRIPGLDTSIVPEAGVGFQLDTIQLSDVGNRRAEVNGESYRFLAGITGDWGNWNYDTAVLYSEADVNDTTSNRVDTTLFQAQLNNTPGAYNIFSGLNPADAGSLVDLTPNPQSAIDPFLTSVTREAKTTLSLVDFRLSNPSVFSLPAGDAALGLGVEYREEDLVEDNSANLDGSAPFVDTLGPNGTVINPSNVIGSSQRLDFAGERDVFSAYAELILPIARDLPGANSIDVQLAARYEDFSDFGNITTPKIAISWYPVEWLQFRAAFSEGFRAPNLVQTNNPQSTVSTSTEDFALGELLGTGDLSDSGLDATTTVEVRGGNPNLEAEDSENTSFGFVLTPLEGLTVTVDYWEIETDGTVGSFNDENQSRLDALLRRSGGSNPNVIRAAPSAENPIGEIQQVNSIFENLNTRSVSGIDFSAFYNFDTSIGSFDLQLNVAQLDEFSQEPGGQAGLLLAAGATPESVGVEDRVGLEGFPEYRLTGTVTWNSNDDLWGASLFLRHIDSVIDPNIVVDDVPFEIDSYTTANLSLVRRDIFGENSSLRLSVNNITDEEPPLADQAFGFDAEMHSSRGRYVALTFKRSFGAN
ncbi:TonB-dependent receptor [bacterium SCSIO 12696]|nr:TonB-dependent receptor [bacterium SCSIO 12696]